MPDTLSMALTELLRKAAAEPDLDTLRDGTIYEDLGTTYFDERDRVRVTQCLVHRLRTLGVTVALSPTTS